MKRMFFSLLAVAAVASVFAVRPRAQVVIAQSTNAVVQTTYYRPYRITFQFAVDAPTPIAVPAMRTGDITGSPECDIAIIFGQQ